jgi:hypothetical protein
MRWPVAYLAVFALLFAPAGDEGTRGSTRVAREGVDPRIIAPTVREGMVASDAKLTARYVPVAEKRVQSVSIPPAVASGMAALLLVWAASFAAGIPTRRRRRFYTRRALVPRAPPALASI